MTFVSTFPEQFEALPLHDATLAKLCIDWSQRVCVASVLAFVQTGQQASEHQVVWHGVTEVFVPHRAPWGDSAFIHAVRVDEGVFIVQMQSGDEIRIVAEKFEFR